MQYDPKFIKIQPSNGLIRDKQGKTAGLIWIFRPNITVKDRHWFEDPDDSKCFLCIEDGLDGFPVDCKIIFPQLDGPTEWKRIADEDILEMFQVCCNLLSKKGNEMRNLGTEILRDMLSGDTK